MIFWTELDAGRCVVVEDAGESRKIRHPDSGRAKYFVRSRAGHWYWLGPVIDGHGARKGYIIK